MHVKGTFPPYNAKMPPQVLHITAVPTEQGILSAFVTPAAFFMPQAGTSSASQ